MCCAAPLMLPENDVTDVGVEALAAALRTNSTAVSTIDLAGGLQHPKRTLSGSGR